MRFRWKIVMLVARLLRVKMYDHWAEQPSYLLDGPFIPCARCRDEASCNVSGTPLCSKHDAEIRTRRLKTGIYGVIEPFEWDTDLSVKENHLADFARYRTLHPAPKFVDDLSDVSLIAARLKALGL